MDEVQRSLISTVNPQIGVLAFALLWLICDLKACNVAVMGGVGTVTILGAAIEGGSYLFLMTLLLRTSTHPLCVLTK